MILGRTTTSKNFINVCGLEVPETAAVRTKGESDAPFFGRFFTFRPLFLMAKVNIFEIFFLGMVDKVFTRNRSPFNARFYNKF